MALYSCNGEGNNNKQLCNVRKYLYTNMCLCMASNVGKEAASRVYVSRRGCLSCVLSIMQRDFFIVLLPSESCMFRYASVFLFKLGIDRWEAT